MTDRSVVRPLVLLWMPLLAASASTPPPQPPAPAPFGPTPSPAQLAWHDREFYAFIHFAPNTFTGREWGYGDESPGVFNPTDFDADQIVATLAAAGATGAILTCTHHDGFALWDSAHTTHDVASSPWMDGRGDVVRAIADACARHGLAFGVYLSPWDRNHAEYARPAYIDYFRAQLTELLTNYGPIFEVWFDGANGGDGYYAGARETRHIDRATYYGWPETFALVRTLQPGAVIFSDIGPDVRWVGNEAGFAGDPCWATYTPPPAERGGVAAPGSTDYRQAEHGHRDGAFWMPAEADVSIRPGWFYHEQENDRVRSPENLFDLYMKSVGRGAAFLLNVPPDRRGRIHETDAASLGAFGRTLRETFGTDLAAGARAVASNTRAGNAPFAASNVTDSDPQTYWATDDQIHAAEVTLELSAARTFNIVSLREFLPLGQRIDRWAIDVWRGDGWVEIGAGEAIGARRLVWTDPVTTDRVRLRVVAARAAPAISEFGIHFGPLRPEP
jgi:alpha-L-fucosidase